MRNTIYESQKKISIAQFLTELPTFIFILISLILSKSILVFVDMCDSLGYILRFSMVAILSKKLTKDLRFKYNYGVGKVEAISSVSCDGLLFFGFIITIGIAIYSIINPTQTSDLLITAVGAKVFAVTLDIIFFKAQRNLSKKHKSAITVTEYEAAKAALLSDIITLVSLILVYLFRNYQIGLYLSPILSILISLYLMLGCITRIKNALNELTDKTLPEDIQMKILNLLVKFYNEYSQIHSINSRKSGDLTLIDLHLSFKDESKFKEIVNFKKEIEQEFVKVIGNCSLNIIVVNEN